MTYLGEHAPERFAEWIARHGLTRVGSGNFRVVYRTRSGRYVVKFPLCGKRGEVDNRYEATGFAAGAPEYARCRVITVAGSVCLVMEWVEPLDHTGPPFPLPEWVDWIDCQQVGYTRRGELVAYDFA